MENLKWWMANREQEPFLDFWKGIINASGKKTINDINENIFLSFRLNWTVINNLSDNDSLETFYVLVNKRGKHLSTPELFKAEYHDTQFLSLVEELLDLQLMINLNLFSDTLSKRMNDRSFIEELVAYLKEGIKDKKDIVEAIYKLDITEEEFISLKNRFIRIIEKINKLNNFYPINKTRYKQKNDFYTLFSFVDQNINESDDLFLLRYKSLLLIAPEIKPSNDECIPFREYANNCVTQSNSKNARLKRLEFFNLLLKNKDFTNNEEFNVILDYLEERHKISNINLINKEGYSFVNFDLFKNSFEYV